MLARKLTAASARAAAAPWWRAGGAPEPVAVYQPIGAASLANSYVNLVNPGTFDAAPGVAPTWASGTGWTFNGTDQHLTTGIQALTNQSQAMIVRFSNAVVGFSVLAGALDESNANGFALQPSRPNNRIRYWSGSFLQIDAVFTSGVIGVAADKGYRNGSQELGSISAATPEIGHIFIGAANRFGTGATAFLSCNVQAVAIYDTSTDHATWVPAVSAAMAAL